VTEEGVDPTHHLAGLVVLAERLQDRFLSRGLTLAVAESCTGGLLGHLLTEVPGSSGYFLGGAISYSDAAKRSLLEVSEAALERHGAVSAQVAVAMAEGARSRFGADVAAAVTGVAGPSGGTAAKPVGLTYVAVADRDGHDVRRFTWSGDRSANKRASAAAALELLLERLGERDGTGDGQRRA
jgi:PncC family amidohydrolase